MNIREIHIYGFGKWREKTFQIDAPFALFYGPNEAGKSTLLSFVRSILFGFANRNHPERYEPEGTSRHGGYLVIETEEGRRIRVERTAGFQGGRNKSSGQARIWFEDGTEGGEEELKRFLGGMSSELFRNLFAFGLGELQEIGTLHSREISGYLYSAGLGADGSAIIAAEEALTEERNKLYRPRGSREINQIARELEDLGAELRKSKENVEKYNEWQDKLEGIQREIAEVEEELKKQREFLAWVEMCVQGRSSWVRMKEIERELGQLDGTPTFPEDGVQRYETLVAERENLHTERSRYLRKIEQTKTLLENLQIDEKLLERKNEAERLLERLSWYQEAQSQITELRAEIHHLEEQLAALIRQIDGTWTQVTLERFNPSLPEREQVRTFRERFDALNRKRERMESEKRRVLEEISLCEKRRGDLEQKRLEWEEQTQNRYGWAQGFTGEELEGRLSQLDLLIKRRKDAEDHQAMLEQALKMETDRLSRTKKRLWSGGAALGLSACILFFFAFPENLWTGGLILFVCLAFFGGISFFLGTPKAVQDETRRLLEDARGKLEQMDREILCLKEDLAQEALIIGGGMPQGPGAQEAASALEDVLGHQAQWREMIRLYKAHESAKKELDSRLELLEGERKALDERIERLEAERLETEQAWRALNGEWGNWLAARCLKENLSPEIVQDIFRLAEQGHLFMERRNRAQEKLNTLLEQKHTFEMEAKPVLSDPPIHTDMASSLKALKESLDRESGKKAREAELKKQLQEWEEEAQLLTERMERIDARILELLKEGGAENEEQFRANANKFAKARLLEEEYGHLSVQIETWIGPQRKRKFFEEMESKDAARLEQERREQKRVISELEERLNALWDERGRLRNELEKLRSGKEHAQLIHRYAQKMAILRQEAEQWAVLSLCVALFQKARDIYEQERQPAVLKRASGYFASITQGKYERILAPIGEKRIVAVRSDGEHMDTSRLSRGTAEQLYLSMRLALAREYGKNLLLPMIMDDILVNFDPVRLRQTLKVLDEISRSHPMIMFTCHSHVVEAAKEMMGDMQLIELEG